MDRLSRRRHDYKDKDWDQKTAIRTARRSNPTQKLQVFFRLLVRMWVASWEEGRSEILCRLWKEGELGRMTVAEKLETLKDIIAELNSEYCENCQEWDCDYCRAEAENAERRTDE